MRTDLDTCRSNCFFCCLQFVVTISRYLVALFSTATILRCYLSHYYPVIRKTCGYFHANSTTGSPRHLPQPAGRSCLLAPAPRTSGSRIRECVNTYLVSTGDRIPLIGRVPPSRTHWRNGRLTRGWAGGEWLERAGKWLNMKLQGCCTDDSP